MVISLGGVVMIAKPSFLFGGKGINKLGLVLALMQVTLKQLYVLEMLRINCISAFTQGIVHPMHALRALTPDATVGGTVYQMTTLRALSNQHACWGQINNGIHGGHCPPNALIEGSVHYMQR